MNIIKTTDYKMIQLKQEQLTQISSIVKIQDALKQDDCLYLLFKYARAAFYY